MNSADVMAHAKVKRRRVNVGWVGQGFNGEKQWDANLG
jgi:hypothetical protein